MRQAGFTLVELMIAVAILAIIAAVALPIYNQYSQRTYRAEAQADLLNCAQGLERYAAQNFTYTGAVLANVCTPGSVAQGRYGFALAIPDNNEFDLTATPVAGGVMDGDGVLTYNEAGDRTWDGNPTWEE
jgi:type IV pilus assembly protein PilE